MILVPISGEKNTKSVKTDFGHFWKLIWQKVDINGPMPNGNRTKYFKPSYIDIVEVVKPHDYKCSPGNGGTVVEN